MSGEMEWKSSGICGYESPAYRGLNHIERLSDAVDPGFDVSPSVPEMSDVSILENTQNTQQNIFDRLPLSQSKRKEFYNWLLNPESEEPIKPIERTNNEAGQAASKRKRKRH